MTSPELLTGEERWLRLGGALILAALALRGLAGALRSDREAGDPPRTGGASSAFWHFVGLTALNPLTALYFTVLAAGLGARIHGGAAAALFVLGVFAASWTWQSALAVTGALVGARLPARARVWTSVAGHGIVLALAAALAVGA